MRLVFAGGGTGGHVYPCVAVVAALRERGLSFDSAYIGTQSGAEAHLVPEHGIRFYSVPSAPVRERGLVTGARALWTVGRGVWQAERLLRDLRPSAVFATGGYVSVPIVVAAWLRGAPVLLFLPDAAPGLAVRATARLVKHVACSTEAALPYFSRRRAVVTGYPVRPDFWQADRADVRRDLGVPDDAPLVLVTGGSQGAHLINEAVAGRLHEWLALAHLVHLTGTRDEPWLRSVRDALPEVLRPRYRVLGYAEDLPALMCAADLAVMRAGASVIGELPAAGLPAILIPGTYAGAHQRHNARYLAGAGAAVMLEESDLLRLLPLARSLLHDPDRLASMAAAARALQRPDAAQRLAAELWRLAS